MPTPTFKTRLTNLLTVKSVVTFLLTGAFVYLAIDGRIEANVFMTVYTTVIGFYFGTQHEKKG
ncbi:MAG: hypothetical protein J6Y02_12070 [Pseudobutyrivibrio sp.]|nr:hypothetical protein [Pseudobutyrivibrio sp.]